MKTITGKVTRVGRIKDYGHTVGWDKERVSIPRFFMEVESKELGTVCAMVDCKAEQTEYGWRIPKDEERQRPLVADWVKLTTHRLRENGNGSVWASVTWNQKFKITRESKTARKEREKWIAEKKAEREAEFKAKGEEIKQSVLDSKLEELGQLETQKYDDRLPDAVCDEINVSFDFDTILKLLRDTVWFVTPEGEGGKQCHHDPQCGCGYPGTGMRRPGGVLHSRPASVRKSILDKAIKTGLIFLTEDGDCYKASVKGIKTLVAIDTCPECGELRRPYSYYSHYTADYPSGNGIARYPKTSHHGATWFCPCEKKELEGRDQGSGYGATLKNYKSTEGKLKHILSLSQSRPRFTAVFMKEIKESPLVVCTCRFKEPVNCSCGGVIHLVKRGITSEALCDKCGTQWFSYAIHNLHTRED